MTTPTLSSPPRKVASTKQPLRAVIYGSPGVGKTTLALTFPRPVIVNTNLGLEGDAVDGRDDLVEILPRGHRDVSAAYFWIKQHADDFDTIVFDDGPTLVRTLLNEVVDEGDPLADYDIDKVPAQREYLASQKQMERILDDFRRLGKHIVLLGGVRQPMKDGAPVGKRALDVSPGILSVVHDWASLIGELAVLKLNAEGEPSPQGKPTRVLFLDPSSDRRECKARWETLQPHVINPTFDTLWTKITAKEVK